MYSSSNLTNLKEPSNVKTDADKYEALTSDGGNALTKQISVASGTSKLVS